jgi:predicted amidohydrolase
MNGLRISLLHLALQAGALDSNQALVERGIRAASGFGADWVVTPELCISGYRFPDSIGTGWVEPYPDKRTTYFRALAKSLHVAIFLGHVERDRAGKLYNFAVMIDASGSIIGHHRKINVAAEQWASAGTEISPIQWSGLKLGILICSDAYTRDIAATLRSKGAQLLVSPTAWGPGLHGPEGEWESRSAETGLPLIVCNRTGIEDTLDFSLAESLVIKNGNRLLAHRSERSAVLTFDWGLDEMAPISKQFDTTYL